MKKLLLLVFTFLSFYVNAQVTEGQTWEMYEPGVKFKYIILQFMLVGTDVIVELECKNIKFIFKD